MWHLALALLVLGCKSESVLDSAPSRSPSTAGYCRGTFTTTAPLSGTTTSPLRPTNTFSIVARDPVTGELGVAVQSHWFSVGSIVTWAEAGAEPAYGPNGLALMREGVAAPDAMAKLVTADPQS